VQPTTELERQLLPAPATIAELPGLRIAVRYQAAVADQPDHGAGAGGDWYLAIPVPDGRVLIAVGDVAGHGRAVITGMLRLYHGLAALAMTCGSPGQVLDWMGDLVQTVGPEHTASALAGFFDPATRMFTWAQAGHPPPVLIRDGAPVPVSRPAGVLLGAPSSGYETVITALRPGDLMLLYTDGLFERRDLLREADAAEAFGAACGHCEPEDAASAVIAAAGANPADDTCLLVFRVEGLTPKVLTF
jgi:serine phosphatase RsbU (regulator of sigma subunit)